MPRSTRYHPRPARKGGVVMQIITGLAVAFWLFWPMLSAGATADYAWEHPGRDPFTGTIDFAVEAKPMPDSAKVKLVEMMRRANVTYERFRQVIEASGFSAEEKKVLDKAKSRSFLAKEHLEEYLAGHKPILDELTKEIDTSVYKVGKLKAGQRCDWMVFGKNAVKSAVVFRPAKTEPQELDGHFFEVDLGGGSKIITFRPLVCNNLCFRAVGFSMTKLAELSASSRKEIAKALAGGGPPEASHTFIYNVWSLSRSTPEGRKLLERLVSGAQGGQSRDLGNKILGAAAVGAVTRGDGSEIFKAEFFDIRLDRAKNERVWVSAVDKGRLVMVDLPLSRMVESVISQGEGWMTFAVKREEKDGVVTYTPPDWATDKIATEIHTPYRGLAYPASGSLKTCGPATAGRCGGDVQSPTALYRRISQPGVTNFHFVVR